MDIPARKAHFQLETMAKAGRGGGKAEESPGDSRLLRVKCASASASQGRHMGKEGNIPKGNFFAF